MKGNERNLHSFDEILDKNSLDFIHRGCYLWKYPSEARYDKENDSGRDIYPKKCTLCEKWLSSKDFHIKHLHESHAEEKLAESDEDSDEVVHVSKPAQITMSMGDVLKRLGNPYRYFFFVSAKSRAIRWTIDPNKGKLQQFLYSPF